MTTPSFVNTRCVRAACDKIGIPYETHDTYGNFVTVQLNGHPYYFVNAATPFNNSAIDKICKDKDFTYKLLKEAVRMPKTKGYFDPYPAEEYTSYVAERDYNAIVADILKEFEFPMIIKMNAGQKGTNVFLCKDETQVHDAIAAIFNHDSSAYDYVALAQEYVEPKEEYRAIVFREKILLAYKKDISNATFTGNLSPLHYENAKAVLIENQSLIEELQTAINPIFPTLDLEFGGIDLVRATDDTFVILELNTHPGFSYFVKDNGEEPLVQMYEVILKEID